MTNQEILTKAIEKAIDCGWVFFEDCILLPTQDWIIPMSITVWNSYLNDKVYIPQQCVIFNHDFAKSLWRKGNTFTHKDGTLITIENPNLWKAKLRGMVVAKDPIKYLGEHI